MTTTIANSSGDCSRCVRAPQQTPKVTAATTPAMRTRNSLRRRRGKIGTGTSESTPAQFQHESNWSSWVSPHLSHVHIGFRRSPWFQVSGVRCQVSDASVRVDVFRTAVAPGGDTGEGRHRRIEVRLEGVNFRQEDTGSGFNAGLL